MLPYASRLPLHEGQAELVRLLHIEGFLAMVQGEVDRYQWDH
jgi:hypothetical protein